MTPVNQVSEDSLSEQEPSLHSNNSFNDTKLTSNREQIAVLESATEQLRMATIERKRMASISVPKPNERRVARHQMQSLSFPGLNL